MIEGTCIKRYLDQLGGWNVVKKDDALQSIRSLRNAGKSSVVEVSRNIHMPELVQNGRGGCE